MHVPQEPLLSLLRHYGYDPDLVVGQQTAQQVLEAAVMGALDLIEEAGETTWAVVCKDDDGERVLASGMTKKQASDKAWEFAHHKKDNTPNNPTIESSGPNAIAVCIGVYKICTYELIEE